METRDGRERRNRRTARLGPRERRSLLQMVVSLLLFLVMFAGQEAFPERAAAWKEELSAILRKNTDFEGAFYAFGESLPEDTPAAAVFQAVAAEVFPARMSFITEPVRESGLSLRGEPLLYKPELTVVQTVADPVQHAVRQDLGLKESATPVLGVLTSAYGMREHPIDGETKMHDGIDLAADFGENILAFADATVDYIGESPAYGMYFQLRHDKGITTFYAHCSQLLVRKGQRVQKGEVVAKVGDTGNTTGSHLHFEMKKDGVFVDPLRYIHYLRQ